jgi:glyoxylase-like metal-dependent hydrolase (beta-lactamase superfamily II)
MELKKFEVGPFTENTYLLTEGDQALLIDPGFASVGEYKAFKSELSGTSVKLKAVCLTHAHVDHILGLHKVLSDFEIPVYLNHSDLFLWKNFEQQSQAFGFRSVGFDFIPESLPEQDDFTIGDFSFNVLYTPGHAPDHVSLYFKEEKMLIAGDVLFFESIGRTDLYKGDFDILAASIREKLYTLPDDTSVYPGHGPATTIGREKKHNAFVKAE